MLLLRLRWAAGPAGQESTTPSERSQVKQAHHRREEQLVNSGVKAPLLFSLSSLILPSPLTYALGQSVPAPGVVVGLNFCLPPGGLSQYLCILLQVIEVKGFI